MELPAGKCSVERAGSPVHQPPLLLAFRLTGSAADAED